MFRKKWITLFLIGLVMIGSFSVRSYGNAADFTDNELQNPNTDENKKTIGKKVLSDTKREGQFELSEISKIDVYYGDILKNENAEAVVSVSFGPKNTIVVAYTSDGEVYEYVGEIGEFYSVPNVSFIENNEKNENIVLINEYADQRVGAYEENTFLRGYVYRDNNFQKVLNTPLDITASWNTLWDSKEFQKESNWQRVSQKTESKWQKNSNPELLLNRKQGFLTSSDKVNKNIPNTDTFSPKKERAIVEKYYWSDKWRRFILSERTDLKTGDIVAVIENFELSPYVLTGENLNKSRIVKKDGTEDIVDNNTLS